MQPCPVELQMVKQIEPRVLQGRCNTLVPVLKGKHVKPFDLNELRTIAMHSNVL